MIEEFEKIFSKDGLEVSIVRSSVGACHLVIVPSDSKKIEQLKKENAKLKNIIKEKDEVIDDITQELASSWHNTNTERFVEECVKRIFKEHGI